MQLRSPQEHEVPSRYSAAEEGAAALTRLDDDFGGCLPKWALKVRRTEIPPNFCLPCIFLLTDSIVSWYQAPAQIEKDVQPGSALVSVRSLACNHVSPCRKRCVWGQLANSNWQLAGPVVRPALPDATS